MILKILLGVLIVIFLLWFLDYFETKKLNLELENNKKEADLKRKKEAEKMGKYKCICEWINDDEPNVVKSGYCSKHKITYF